jgi:hypothetical protein
MDSTSKDLRINQSLCELARLREALKNWQEDRKDADKHENGEYRGQYQTQIGVIAGEVGTAAGVIEDGLNQLTRDSKNLALAAVYQQCARADRKIIWLWRAWDFFREKFDQRDLPVIGPAVRAADEVLWSCFKPFYKGMGTPLPPTPLPYVEFTYTPVAVKPDQVSHVEKEEEIDEGPLKNFFAKLPLPLLQLPPTAVSAPWAHVLIGHEAGHFIQESIPANEDFRKVFRGQVEAAAERVKKGTGTVWSKWAAEIFADMYSVITMGPWAVWVIGQFELARPGKITTRAANYPSALTRIYLLAQFASKAGLGDADAHLTTLGIDAKASAETDEARTDLQIADEVASLINETLPGDGRMLRDVIGFKSSDYDPGDGLTEAGPVQQWADALSGKKKKQDEQDIRAARMVAAGSAQAWKLIGEMSAGKDRDAAIAVLRTQTFPHMIACAEGGTREAPAAKAAVAGQPSLSQIIQQMSDDELFQ